MAAGVVGVAGLPTGEYEGPISERRTGRKRRPWAAPKTQIPKNCLKKLRKMYAFAVERMRTARKSSSALSGEPRDSAVAVLVLDRCVGLSRRGL